MKQLFIIFCVVYVAFGSELLKPFIGVPEGISLMADNGKFLGRIHRDGRQRIEAVKEVKEPYTRFVVTKKANNTVLLKADNDKYWCLILRRNIYYLEATKTTSDSWCEFQAFDFGRKLVLKAHNGLFLSRISRDGSQSIEAAKAGIDQSCRFGVKIGELIPPRFEILDVTWDSSVNSVVYNPTVVYEDTFVNGGTNPVGHEFTLDYSKSTSETTTWTHSWGFEASFTFSAGLFSSIVSNYEFSAKISYDGSKSSESSKTNEATFGRKVIYNAPPLKKSTLKLIVKKADDVSLPFTAKIRRTNADGSTRILYEQGVWTGVGYHSAYIEVEETDLKISA